MESFSLTGANGWQTLSSLLSADLTFKGRYLWTQLAIQNTHASQTMIIKSLPGSTAPASDSGINLGPGDGFNWQAGAQGVIDGRAVWIKCSAGSTTFDVTFIRKEGVNI